MKSEYVFKIFQASELLFSFGVTMIFFNVPKYHKNVKNFTFTLLYRPLKRHKIFNVFRKNLMF